MNKVTLQAKLGVAIRRRRLASEYSQESFADAIGMHRAYYSSIERGERNLTLTTVERVANGLGCKIADLMLDAAI
ncbi:MAG: XRE family transcriptional regulator [Rhodanobacteraceae bacterium]|jgi:transcriptional regulator with XRE-family HTH domain|nr:MAG: XRE family transcriptional regulator [Rhodanobacteraceae bacterium]